MGTITIYPQSGDVAGPVQSSPAFAATAGQTTFTPAFTLGSNPVVLVNGSYQSWGWSIVAGSVVFAIGLVEGTEVKILNG